MALKARSKNIVTTARGKKIDFEKLRRANETETAIGNVPVNARGDEIGPGGKIIKKKQKEVYCVNVQRCCIMGSLTIAPAWEANYRHLL